VKASSGGKSRFKRWVPAAGFGTGLILGKFLRGKILEIWNYRGSKGLFSGVIIFDKKAI
jgi:hypothetical protein